MLLALAAQPTSAAPPAPADAPAVTEAKTDSEVWALARQVDAVGAFETYLRRFPSGANRAAAIERWYRLQDLPPQPSLPAAPMPATTPVAYAAYPDPCVTALGNPNAAAGGQAEAAAFAGIRRSNRLSDFQAHLRAYPGGICAGTAEAAIRRREARRALFPAIAGFGPLAAQASSRSILSDADYPAAALRAEESGDATAAWEVAEDGLVESCRVVRSSGSSALDTATCRIITSRMRYDPARDAAGNPIRAEDRMSIGWRIAGGPPAKPSE